MKADYTYLLYNMGQSLRRPFSNDMIFIVLMLEYITFERSERYLFYCHLIWNNLNSNTVLFLKKKRKNYINKLSLQTIFIYLSVVLEAWTIIIYRKLIYSDIYFGFQYATLLYKFDLQNNFKYCTLSYTPLQFTMWNSNFTFQKENNE